MSLNIEEMATFCKAKGFVYPNSEIYGGMSGFFDYGPLGVEVKNSIKQHYWKRFVQSRPDVVGIDGTILSHPQVWKASGHADCFTDAMVYCKKHKSQFRCDQLIEEVLKKPADGMSKEDMLSTIKDQATTFTEAGYDLELEVKDFNLMFTTHVGPLVDDKNKAFLRPETAQLIFTNFRLVMDTCRQKLPFGIAQIGKAFRNEISPRDFLFRTREFEQMEIEFFIHPDEKKCALLVQSDKEFTFNIITEDEQKKEGTHTPMTLGAMLDAKLLGEWHVYWLKEVYSWFLDLGIKPENLRLREHLSDELAHYSSACFDIEYHFPFGWKEIHGNANRGTFDLEQHKNYSKQKLEVFDEESKQKVLPRVIEPSQGVDRAFLSFMYDAYDDNKERGNIVLHLHPQLAPIKVAVFPLVNKLKDEAQKIFDDLKDVFPCTFDSSGSVGRRYARADEMGIPYCVTLDFEEDGKVTVRDRDSTEQERVTISDLKSYLLEKLY